MDDEFSGPRIDFEISGGTKHRIYRLSKITMHWGNKITLGIFYRFRDFDCFHGHFQQRQQEFDMVEENYYEEENCLSR